ncbi:MAG: type II toxin-antitoxin system VapC family toxin [Bryobacterales bacterium]|nr:type II toxin-antitoxin system VapC family toxin [Bryobacterales bacterium]
MPRLLLDTHILVRWSSDAKKLTREQRRVLEAAARNSEPLAISAVTLLEVALLSNGGKLKAPLDDFFADLEADPLVNVIPLTYEVASEFGSMGVLQDPSDRAIVATARIHGLRLVTSDQRIIESQLVPVVE